MRKCNKVRFLTYANCKGTNIYLRSPETCMDENIWTVPPESLTESTKVTYFCRSVISLFLQNVMLLFVKINNHVKLRTCFFYANAMLTVRLKLMNQSFLPVELNPKGKLRLHDIFVEFHECSDEIEPANRFINLK